MREVLVFDVDDTLLNTSCVYWEVKDSLIARVTSLTGEGVSMACSRFQEFETAHGKRHGHSPTIFGNLIEGAFLLFAGSGAEKEARMLGDAAREKIDTWECPPLPGAIEALMELKRKGARIALCTKARSVVHQRQKLERWGLDKIADTVHIVRQKGAAEILEAARAAGMKTGDEAWMTGDSLHDDIRGAREAGLNAAWIRSRKHIWRPEGAKEAREAGAQIVISHVKELEERIRALKPSVRTAR